MIYIIKAEGTNSYKIGYTKDIAKRLKSLQTGCPNNLKIIDIFHGDYRKEREIQEQFKKSRIRENGEWFEFNPKLFKKVLKQINNNSDNAKSSTSDYYKDLILDKVNSYYIKDMVISSDKNEFYIQWEKKDGRTEKQKDFDERRKTGRKISRIQYNKRQGRWYRWRSRAKKVGISPLESRRPTLEERTKWRKAIEQAEKKINKKDLQKKLK